MKIFILHSLNLALSGSHFIVYPRADTLPLGYSVESEIALRDLMQRVTVIFIMSERVLISRRTELKRRLKKKKKITDISQISLNVPNRSRIMISFSVAAAFTKVTQCTKAIYSLKQMAKKNLIWQTRN